MAILVVVNTVILQSLVGINGIISLSRGDNTVTQPCIYVHVTNEKNNDEYATRITVYSSIFVVIDTGVKCRYI